MEYFTSSLPLSLSLLSLHFLFIKTSSYDSYKANSLKRSTNTTWTIWNNLQLVLQIEKFEETHGERIFSKISNQDCKKLRFHVFWSFLIIQTRLSSTYFKKGGDPSEIKEKQSKSKLAQKRKDLELAKSKKHSRSFSLGNSHNEKIPERVDYGGLGHAENNLFTTIQTLQDHDHILPAITEVDDENKITVNNRNTPSRDEPERPEKPENDSRFVSPKPSHKRIFSMQQVTYEMPLDGSYSNSVALPSAQNSARDSTKSVQTCLVCFDKFPDAVFMDCGHGGICYDCSLDLWKTNGECYLCREVLKINQKIIQILQIEIKSKSAPPSNSIKVISATHIVETEDFMK